MRWKKSTVGLLMAAVVLSGCAQLSERQAVNQIRQNKRAIAYNDDVKVKSNRTLFGFRSLPQRVEAAAVTMHINKNTAEVGQCLRAQLQSRFKLPEEFFEMASYANNAQTVALVNPFTKKQGVLMDVVATGVGSSEVRLYANGTTLSRAWKSLPAACR